MRTALSAHTQRVLAFALVATLSVDAIAQQPALAPPQTGPVMQAAGAASVRPAQATAPQTTTTSTTAAPATTPAAATPAQNAAMLGSTKMVAATPAVTEKPRIIHSLFFPDPASHELVVKAAFPTDWKPSIDLMMSVWTPGFYRVDDYASKVLDFKASLPTGEVLTVEKPAPNRWRIQTQEAPIIVVTYRLICDRGSVAQSVINPEYAVICGGPTYMTIAGDVGRPHEVRLNLPTQWSKSATGLGPATDSFAHHYLAKDFDQLMDSPIAIGNLQINSFVVDNARHHLVDIGDAKDLANWDGAKKIEALQKMVEETRNFWGFLPFNDYYFLNKVTRAGGGGLEHLNSTLIHTAPPRRAVEPRATQLRWLNFVAHEYFHTYNVKRLRPVELGPFDYEHARRTSGLWVAEGLTNYFNSLMIARAKLCTPQEYLGTLSGHIRTIQTAPGRLAQSLASSSLDTWTGDGFGGNRPRESTISYYEKGPIVGFLLDAKIRRATGDKKSADDVMRLAYSRFAQAKGYTEQEFLDTAQEVAGMDLKEFFDKNLFSTEETDFTDALDWFGLQFAASENGPNPWRLEVRPDATEDQQKHMISYFSSSKAPAPVVAAKTAPATTPATSTTSTSGAPSTASTIAAATTPPKTATAPTTTTAPNATTTPSTTSAPTTAATTPPRTGTQPLIIPMTASAPLVEGLGGTFIFSNDPGRLAAWYRTALGFEPSTQNDGAFVFVFRYRRNDDPNALTETVWAILPSRGEALQGPPQVLLNYRVPDMDVMLRHLAEAGVEIEKKADYPHGRFAWLRDPDGNRVELFQKLEQ